MFQVVVNRITADSQEHLVLDKNDILSQILEHLILGDLGKKYLQSTLLPIIKECVQYTSDCYGEVTSQSFLFRTDYVKNSAELDLVESDGNTSWIKTDWINNTISNFLEKLPSSCNLCPV